jgi:hypothetical protein
MFILPGSAGAARYGDNDTPAQTWRQPANAATIVYCYFG